MNHPAYTTMIPQGFGAGVGRVGGYYEQGNWYRGGAVQMLFIAWLYGEQNQIRPTFPPNTSREMPAMPDGPPVKARPLASEARISANPSVTSANEWPRVLSAIAPTAMAWLMRG